MSTTFGLGNCPRCSSLRIARLSSFPWINSIWRDLSATSTSCRWPCAFCRSSSSNGRLDRMSLLLPPSLGPSAWACIDWIWPLLPTMANTLERTLRGCSFEWVAFSGGISLDIFSISFPKFCDGTLLFLAPSSISLFLGWSFTGLVFSRTFSIFSTCSWGCSWRYSLSGLQRWMVLVLEETLGSSVPWSTFDVQGPRSLGSSGLEFNNGSAVNYKQFV